MGYGQAEWVVVDGEAEVDTLRRENARLRAIVEGVQMDRERTALALIETSIAVYAAVTAGMSALAVGNTAVERLNAICDTLRTEEA